MSKVLVIIIDAMDSIQVSKYEYHLPNLKKLKKDSPEITLTSVYPPDSPTALASIYTGLNPARHGVVHFVDPLERASIMSNDDFDNTVLKGNTFWDIAGRFGRKVCVILPFLGYPVWPVNGIMVGKSAVKDDVQIFPKSLSGKYDLSLLNTVRGFPGRKGNIALYLERQRSFVLQQLDLTLKMLTEESWDLSVFYSGIIDSIHHPFWRYCDEKDPSYPGPNPYQNVIKDFYFLHDQVIGKLIEAVDSDTTVILLSDHGHGMRPIKLLNINEFLRQRGFLIPRAKNIVSKGLVHIIEKVKRLSLDFVSRHDMGNSAAMLLRLFPSAKKVYTSPLSIDWSKTLAYVSDLSGIKSYPYGGINIVKENLTSKDYEELRDLIIGEIREIKEPNTNEKLVNLICRREDLYSGEYLNKYPDIVLELKDDWGIGWSIHESLFGTSPAHSIVPGSHKVHSPVYFMSNLQGRNIVRKDIELMDVAPTVLDLLEVEAEVNFDGRSLFCHT